MEVSAMLIFAHTAYLLGMADLIMLQSTVRVSQLTRKNTGMANGFLWHIWILKNNYQTCTEPWFVRGLFVVEES